MENGRFEILSDGLKYIYNEAPKFEENTIISIIGSLGNADTYYKELLLEGIKNISSNLHCEKKIYEAYYGSCLKAKELTKC